MREGIRSPKIRVVLANATPISRLSSRYEFIHRLIAVAMDFSSPLQSSEILSVRCVTAFQSKSHPFSLNWLQTESHQTPIEIKHAALLLTVALAAVAAPEKRWCQTMSNGLLSQSRGCRCRNASHEWLIAWATQSLVNSRWRKGHVQSEPWILTSRITGSYPLRQTFTRSSALHQTASALATCGSKHVPVYAPAP